MSDYIKIEEAAKALSVQTPYSYNDCLNMLVSGITNGYAKATSVREDVQGTWDSDERCSVCGEKSTEGLDAEKWNYWFPNFCPNCGARMIGV